MAVEAMRRTAENNRTADVNRLRLSRYMRNNYMRKSAYRFLKSLYSVAECDIIEANKKHQGGHFHVLDC